MYESFNELVHVNISCLGHRVIEMEKCEKIIHTLHVKFLDGPFEGQCGEMNLTKIKIKE